MTALRRDAARNRERILAAARELTDGGVPLQLNAVARHAEVGVGTVYRHFSTAEALAEGVIEYRFAELTSAALAAADKPDARTALHDFLVDSVRVFAEDATFAAAVVSSSPARPETAVLRNQLIDAFAALVTRAAPHLAPGLNAVDLMILICGLGYSVRLRPERAVAYLEGLLGGVLR